MRRAEKVILSVIAVVLVIVAGIKAWLGQFDVAGDRGIPFYSTATPDLARHASALYQDNSCKSCHTLWATRDMTQAVPAPPLDGIGSIHDEQWFFAYFSAEDPQSVLPSRLKKQYRMPSFAQLPESDRRVLAQYMASLKVKDWYLEEVKKTEYEKLTGNTYTAAASKTP